MPKGVIRLFAIMAAFILVLAACGDSGDSTDDTSSSPTATAGSGDSDGNGDGDGNGGDGTVVTIGTLPDVAGLSGDCEALLELFLGFGSVLIGGLGDAEALFAAAQDELPSSLDDDVAIVAAAVASYSGALDDLGVDLSDPTSLAQLTPAQQQAFAEAGEALSTDAVGDALDNLSAYGEAECADFATGFGN